MRHGLAIEPDVIKLDCSLVSGIDTDPRRQALAEGIERHEEWEVCQDLGISLGQGFYFGRPCPLPA